MNYQEKKYIPLSFIMRNDDAGETIYDFIKDKGDTNLTFAFRRQEEVDDTPAQRENFLGTLAGGIRGKYFRRDGQLYNFVFSRPLPVEILTKTGGAEFARGAIQRMVESWARRNLTRESYLAYLYASKSFEVGEKLEIDAETSNNATTNGENMATVTTTEKFNAMLTTASTGTANKTETLDNRTDKQTTTGGTTSKNSVLREYAGDIKAFKRSFMTDGAGDSIFEMLTLSAERDLFIPVEDLFPYEIIDEGEIKE